MIPAHIRVYARMAAVIAAAVSLSACSLLFPTKAGDDLAHFAGQAPQPGDRAPDFTLTDAAGGTVQLNDLLGTGPIVLQVGSHSCPVYRYRSYEMRDLHAEYAGRVQFLVIYTQEAHPKGSPSPYRDEEWLTPINRVAGVEIPQHGTMEERLAQALESTTTLSLDTQVAVDGMDNRVWELFGSAPSPAFVLDREGTIVLRQVWVNPGEIKDALDRLLQQSTGGVL